MIALGRRSAVEKPCGSDQLYWMSVREGPPVKGIDIQQLSALHVQNMQSN